MLYFVLASLPRLSARNGESKKRVMSKVAFKGIPYPCMAMLPVLSPSPYAILCIEQVSTIENVVM